MDLRSLEDLAENRFRRDDNRPIALDTLDTIVLHVQSRTRIYIVTSEIGSDRALTNVTLRHSHVLLKVDRQAQPGYTRWSCTVCIVLGVNIVDKTETWPLIDVALLAAVGAELLVLTV